MLLQYPEKDTVQRCVYLKLHNKHQCTVISLPWQSQIQSLIWINKWERNVVFNWQISLFSVEINFSNK